MPENEKKKKKSKDSGKDGITTLIVPIDKVSCNSFNYNRQSNFIFDKQKESILYFGFVEPITCRIDPGSENSWEIINGEHRYIALKELFEAGETIYLDPPNDNGSDRRKLKKDHIPIRSIGSISDAEAKKLCIVLNETKGRPNQDDLADLIAGLKSEDIDLLVLPYTEEELDSYLRLASGNLEIDDDEDDSDGDDLDDSDDDVGGDYNNQNDIIELCVTLFSLDSMPREVIDKIYPIYTKFIKANKILRSESWKGLEVLLENWDG